LRLVQLVQAILEPASQQRHNSNAPGRNDCVLAPGVLQGQVLGMHKHLCIADGGLTTTQHRVHAVIAAAALLTCQWPPGSACACHSTRFCTI
jgi:hypothetical protein